jgi:hypothetical protein
MPAHKRNTVYDQAVHITEPYLGPAASRFVDRQIRNHLHKEPGDLTENDLSQLIHWMRLAISVLTADSHVVNEYISQIEGMTHSQQPDK